MQTGCRPSKDGNDAMSMYALSETDSDYIRQPRLPVLAPPEGEFAAAIKLTVQGILLAKLY